MERPVFEVHERNGKRYRIWADGHTDGFGDGAVVCNGILPLFNAATTRTELSSTADRRREAQDSRVTANRTEQRQGWFLRMWQRLVRSKV